MRKLREKEQRKNIENLVMSKEAVEGKELHEKLSSFVELIDSVHKTEKRPTLLKEAILHKAHHSIKVKSASQLEKLFDMALAQYPEWIELLKCKDKIYIKLNPKCDIKTLMKVKGSK